LEYVLWVLGLMVPFAAVVRLPQDRSAGIAAG
jgi:hypothetical protein